MLQAMWAVYWSTPDFYDRRTRLSREVPLIQLLSRLLGPDAVGFSGGEVEVRDVVRMGFVWKALEVIEPTRFVAFLLPVMGILHNTSP